VLQSDCQEPLVCANSICTNPASCVSDEDCQTNAPCTARQACERDAAGEASDAGSGGGAETAFLADSSDAAPEDGPIQDSAMGERDGAAEASDAGSGGDGSDAAPEDGPVQDIASDEGTGPCGSACPSLDLCEDSMCRSAVRYGFSSGGDSSVDLLTSQSLYCFQLPPIQMPTCGYLTGVGMAAINSVAAQIRFGVYEDTGGSPAMLLAQTAAETLDDGFGGDFPISPPVLVGCAPNAMTTYWICVLSNEDITPKTVAASSTEWTLTPANPPSVIQAELQSGFPCNDPTSIPSPGPVPLIYTWFVETMNSLAIPTTIQCDD
jgi:hypothetical protein